MAGYPACEPKTHGMCLLSQEQGSDKIWAMSGPHAVAAKEGLGVGSSITSDP